MGVANGIKRLVLIGVIGIGLIALPHLVSDYRTFQMTMVLVWAIAVLGLNLLLGYNGQLSLGHGAFYAIGAYTTAMLMAHAAVPYWATVIPAGLLCLVFGFLFGIPALRLSGHHLALATFALALVMPQLLKSKGIEAWTGGVQGLVLDKPVSPLAGVNDDQWVFYFVAAITVLLFLAARNLVRGSIGRAMIAVREQPIAAEAMGVNLAMLKSITFGISALYTGVAGSLGAIAVQYVAPDSFGMFLSISILVGVVFGGVGTIAGALIGAVFIQFMPNFADQLSKSAPWAIYGLFLILGMYLMPRGMMGLLQGLSNRLRRRAA